MRNVFLGRLSLSVVFATAVIFHFGYSPLLRSASASVLTDFPVGNEPKSVAIADFNNDGKKDLAVANRGSETVSILLGDGTGNFAAATSFPAAPEPFALAIADFNSDAKADVVVSNPTGGRISLLLGDGIGALGAPTSFLVGENPLKFAVGDFNGDSKSDLAVADAGFNNGGVYILLGTGTGSFGAPTRFTTGPRPRYVEAGDFNVDGKSDLAVANVGSNTISIMIGNGSGGFGAPNDVVVGSSPIGLVLSDFDNDTFLDIAVANTDSHNVSILKGNGQGSFGVPTNFPANSFPLSITSGDFDHDGKLDLAVGTNGTGDRISILRGDGTGQFTPPDAFSTGSGPYDLTAGDVNNDGRSDLIVANGSSHTVSVLLGSFPSVSINSVTRVEGDSGTSPATFVLTLSKASDKPVQLFYSIVGITASAGSDFDNTLIVPLTIPAGSLSANLPVQIFGEQTFEPDETFTVNLASPLNAFIADGQGQGTIVNDDPIPAITINDVSVVEGNTGTRNAIFTVGLSNASFQSISVTLSTSDRTAGAGTDYIARTDSLTFNPSQSTKTFNVVVNGDMNSEPSESFLVNLTNSTNATISRTQGVATIIDDDAAALLTEQNSQRAVAVDSVLWIRDPFPVVNPSNFSPDLRTRITLFAVNLNLMPGDVITVQAEDAQQVIHQLPLEHVGAVPNFQGLTQLVVKLPDEIASAGDVMVSFTLRGATSNRVLISIRPS